MSASSSNGVRTGIFGYLKGLFRRGDETSTITEAGDSSTATEVAPPLMAPPVEVAYAASAPAPAAVSTAPAPAAVRENVDVQGAGVTPSIALPLQTILNGFPNELRNRVRVQAVGDLTVNIAIEKILAQLSQGQVRVPFGDIRKSAPQVFTPGADFDRISVALPLNEVLSRLNPGLLVRRPAVRQVEVPEEISSPFSGHGEGLSLSVGNAKPVQPAAPRKAAPVPPAPVRGSISSVPAPTAPTVTPPPSVPPLFTPKPAAVPPAAAAIPEDPIPFKKATPPPARPATPPPSIPMRPPVAAAAPIEFTPAPASVPAPTPAPVAKPAAAKAGFNSVISTPLSSLSEAWPDALRLEIVQANLTQARVALPVEQVETALKRGRVIFNWKTIRSWISPATPTTVSAFDGAELELPLKVIAPLFLARKSNGPAQKVAVDEAIPNLFFGFPQPEAPAPAPQPAPKPAQPLSQAPAFVPSSVPAPTFTPQHTNLALNSAAAASTAAAAAAATASAPATKPLDTNYYLSDEASDTQLFHIAALKQKGASSTEFVQRYASPNEIVSRAVALEGVAGALIALPDGLMVASRIPAEHNGDTLAAFLPQIFAKVSSCTKELRMGDLNNVSFTVGNVPWKIFRVNAIFFAAFGQAAQPMPTAQLAELASQLDRKGKK